MASGAALEVKVKSAGDERNSKAQAHPPTGARRTDGIINVCPHLAVGSGRVAQLAEQLTLNQ